MATTLTMVSTALIMLPHVASEDAWRDSGLCTEHQHIRRSHVGRCGIGWAHVG